MTDLLDNAIRSELRAQGIIADALDLYADAIRQDVEIDATGNAAFMGNPLGITPVNMDGSEMTLSDFVAAFRSSKPGLFEVEDAGRDDDRDETMTDRMMHLKAEGRGDRGEEAREIVARHGNPWRASVRNLTRQMQLSKLDPEFAGRLRMEAGR